MWGMAADVTLTITLDAALARALNEAAAAHGWPPERLAADCVAQQLEVALRHRALLERLEAVDGAILDMAQAVGELGASSENVDLGAICKFRRGGD
jgi:predicted transcriptional regulator